MGMKARCSRWYNNQWDIVGSFTGATGMESVPVRVGLDYHQHSVQVGVMDMEGRLLGNRACENDWQAIASFAEGYGHVTGAAVEACTGSADLAEELAQKAGWSMHLAHPGYVNRMRQNPDKHDWGDARLLADLERVGYLPQVWLAPQETRELRRLVGYRQQLADERRTTKLRVGALLRDQRQICRTARPWTLGWFHWLSGTALGEHSRWIIERHMARMEWVCREIAVVEKRLEKLTRDDPVVQRLLKHKGIGPVTAWVMRAYIGRFDRFRTGKQLSRFCGLSPRNASSGERQADAGLIKAGHPDLRRTLIEAAHRLMRYDPEWQQRARMLLGRGKPYCVVSAAIANRWMRRLFHEMQTPAQVA
jgi:transposase